MNIHPTAIIGPNVIMALDCVVRQYATVKGDNRIGRRVWIYQYANVGAGTIIEDDVYIGARVTTTNTRRIIHGRPGMERDGWGKEPVVIRRGARIATGAIILPGVTIGEECLIGAGSVVTRSTKPYTVYFGNPAREIGPVPPEEWLRPPE